jgi:anti-sigma regulatory factor (Ser/Thr protein kinase)
VKEQMILKSRIEKGDFNRGGENSSKLKELLRKLGVTADINRRVTIVTYELEMNIIIHSDGGGINVYVTPDAVKVVAEDSGPGIEDLEKALQPGYSTANDEIRNMGFGAGMGLNNVEYFSDELEIDTGPGKRTRITAVINL